MAHLELIVYDQAHAVTESEKKSIMDAAEKIIFPETLDEFVSSAKLDESEMIGSVSRSINSLCQSACEKAGVHPVSKTFMLISGGTAGETYQISEMIRSKALKSARQGWEVLILVGGEK